MNADFSMIMNFIALTFCVSGAIFAVATSVEAYIAWYSGVEFASASLLPLWIWLAVQTALILAAVIVVAYPFLRG